MGHKGGKNIKKNIKILKPDKRVEFNAKVDAGLYNLNKYSYIHILISKESSKKEDYDGSTEIETDYVIFDYDKKGNIIGIEIITAKKYDI